MKLKAFVILMILAMALPAGTLRADEYNIDPDHSAVTFKIRHLVSWVRGEFTGFSGTFNYEPGNPDMWKTEAVIETASIDTNVKERDKHLRSDDFFAAEQYPEIRFVSTGVSDAGQDEARLNGNLTIKGITRPVTLDLEIHGVAEDPWGNVRAAFTAETEINRTDYGLAWNEVLETGKLLVGEKVKIVIEVEGIKA